MTKRRGIYVRRGLIPFDVPAEGAEFARRRVRPLLEYLAWAQGDLLRLLSCAYLQGAIDADQAMRMRDAPPAVVDVGEWCPTP